MIVTNVVIKLVNLDFERTNINVSTMMDTDTGVANVTSKVKQTIHYYSTFKVSMTKIEYQCDICESIFKTLHSCREHKMSVHEGKMFECAECPFKAR